MVSDSERNMTAQEKLRKTKAKNAAIRRELERENNFLYNKLRREEYQNKQQVEQLKNKNKTLKKDIQKLFTIKNPKRYIDKVMSLQRNVRDNNEKITILKQESERIRKDLVESRLTNLSDTTKLSQNKRKAVLAGTVGVAVGIGLAESIRKIRKYRKDRAEARAKIKAKGVKLPKKVKKD